MNCALPPLRGYWANSRHPQRPLSGLVTRADVSSLGAGTSSLCPQGLFSRREVTGVLPWRGLDVEQSGKNVEGGDKLRSGGPAACLGHGPLGRDENCPV